MSPLNQTDSPHSFPSNESPQFSKGCIVNITFQCLGLVIVAGMSLWYRWENKRRDKVEGGRPPMGTALDTIEKFDLAPGKSSVGKIERRRDHVMWSMS